MKLKRTEKVAGNLLDWLFLVLSQKVTENVALRVMLKNHGLTPKKLEQELREVRASALVKRRARARFAPLQKEVLQLIRHIAKEEMLEQLPVSGKLQ